jgi:hypothetical protein
MTTSVFGPLTLPAALPPRTGTRAVPADDQRVAQCVLALVMLIEIAVLFFPHALMLGPAQAAVWFKQASGYTMLVLMTVAVSFGRLRRLPSMGRHQRMLNEIHQLTGLLLFVLMAFHMGESPRGFLLVFFHAMAAGLGAGALRTLLARRIGRTGAIGLLATHISLSCLVCGGALLHLYLVYAYTG